MADITCPKCAGWGREHQGFSDAPHVTCDKCDGFGLVDDGIVPHFVVSIDAETGDRNFRETQLSNVSPPVWGPFKFTEDERKRIRLKIMQYANSLIDGTKRPTQLEDTVNDIEAELRDIEQFSR